MSTDDRHREAAARVLVVDDSKINRLVIMQMLKRSVLGDATALREQPGAIEGVEAESGEQAIAMLRAHSFNLVLMDVQLPGMSGLDATRAIRAGEAGEQNREISIVAMTAYSSSEDEEACYEAGVNGYLAKPLRLQKFSETVRTFLDS